MTSPELLEAVARDGFCQKTLRVSHNLECLEGHFPSFPVVPGMVQIQWVMEAAREVLGSTVVLTRIEALKFREPLRPGQVFRVTVEIAPAGGALQFRLWDGDRLFSSGRCLFSAGPRSDG